MQTGTAMAASWSWTWGQCTYWAAKTRPDIGAVVTGNAANWTRSAQAAGLNTGDVPAPDAIVVYQPGVQGAWGTGHVGHVNDVAPDGIHFKVDEMNFPYAGVMTQRWSVAGPGVSFIY